MRKTVLLLLGMLFMWAGQVNAQWSVDAVETDYTIDFETTVSDVSEGAFDGSGFATTPATGQLDADAWAVYGMSDGDKDFGVENTSGDLARGASTGGETTGGIYSFEVETGNNAIGFQGSAGDFTPGWIGLKLQNNTGETINTVDFSYDVWVLNNDGRSSTLNGEFSLDGSTWFAITELAFSTEEVADASPVWEKTTLTYSDNIGVEINDGDFLYFRWYSDDNGGSGGRDEIAIDNVMLNVSNGGGGSTLALPFYETYETWPLDNWAVEGTSTYVWESNDGTSHGPGSVTEGSLAAMFNVYSALSGNTTTMTTDVIDMDGAINPTLSFDFWMDGWSADPNLWLKVEMTTDGSTWNEIFYHEYDGNSGWNSESISLTGTTATTQIRIIGASNFGSYNIFVDNLAVEEITCPAPTDLALDANTADEATFSWTENGSTTDWNLIYGDPGFDPLTEGTTVAADANPYTITGLTPDTEYDVYIQADCSAGDLSTMAGPVNFTTPAACPQPANLTANAGVDFAELDWDAFGGTEWNIKISDVSIDPETEAGNIEEVTATTDKPYTTTVTLDPNTTYYFYVQTSCGSDWSEEGMFTTPCEAITAFPFTEDFDGDWSTWCWTVVDNDNNGTTWEQDDAYITPLSGDWTAHGMGNADDYLISPGLSINSASMIVEWFDVVENSTYNNTYDVLVSTTNTNIASFTDNLGTFDCSNTEWVSHNLDLSAYDGETIYIAFHQTYSGSSWYGFGIDDVTVRELSSEADILTFELAEQTAPATIDAGALTVEVEVGGATDVTSLTPTITVSDAASIAPESGVAQDFTNPVTYTVTAEDGTENLWEVTVTPAGTLSDENEILTFELAEQTEPATIGAGTVDIEVTWDTDVTSLVPTITVSSLATISPESGVAQDFTNPVTYSVTAEDGSEQDWTVTVTKESTPAGVDCANPLAIALPAELPYTDAGQSTCGMVDDYNETSMGYYDGGEDFIYEITVASDVAVNITLTPTQNYSGIGLFEGCPDGDIMVDNSSNSSATEHGLFDIVLSAGTTYYLMVDSWPSPDCIDFDLTIEETCITPTDVTTTDLLSDAATISWTTGGLETGWNLKVSDTSIDPTTDPGTEFDGTVSTTPEQALSGLTELTDYYVYVQADCGSEWTTEYMFTTPAACPQPANLTANVGVDFAELDWDAFGGTEWNIKISDVSIDPETEAGNIEEASATTTKPYTTTVTLDPNTTYYFYVQTSCGSDWSEEAMFTTNCEAITSFPYFEGFENEWAPECWSNSLWTLSTYGSAYEGDEFAYTNEAGSQLTTVGFELPAVADNMILEFFYRAESSSNPQDLNVNLSTDGVNFTESVAAFSGMTNTDYMRLQYDLSSYAGQTIWVRFEGESGTGGWSYGALIDNFAVREVSSETDFLTYSFPEQTGAADIDYTAYTIDVEVGNGTDLTSLVADFTLSTGATADIAGTPQESGVTANDFSSPVTYTVTAEDGTTIQPWVVTVTEAAINDETDIVSYTFPEATSAATIDATEKTVDIEVAWNADVTALVAEFELSYGATAAIAGTDQESGVTENDFTDPVVYTVTAEDGTTTEVWTVTVTIQDTPQGATCADPFDYGTINDPEVVTSIDPNGRELWYTFTITEPYMNIQVSTCASVYDTKVWVYDACGGTELAYNDDAPFGFCDESNNQSLAEIDFLEAGTYYVLITPYSDYTDISDPTTGLLITGTMDYITPYVDNTTLTLTPETQNVATGNDANGVLDVVYPTTVSDDMPVDMMTDAMIDLSELTAGAVVELLSDGTSLGTYTVTGSETVWASEAFTGVNRVAADMTEGQSLSWDVVISDLDEGTYNVSATLYLGLDADLTAQTNMTEVATDAMEIIVADPFIDLALLMPDGNAYVCDFTDPQNVPVEIENVGNTTIASGETISFILDVNGSNEITEDIILSEDLLPGETYETMTTNTIDFSALGTYEWEATIVYTGDADMMNNFTTGYTVHFEQEIEFIDAVNDTITIASTDWPYTIETDLNLSTDSVLVSTYEWELDGSTETSLTVNEDGWYTVHVTTEYCTTTDSVYVLAYNSIEGITADEFSVYPNPNNGQFMIEMNLVEKQDVLLSIFNSNGQLVREFKFDDIDSFARQIDMNNVAEGLYLIRINAGGKMFNSQVVIR